MGANDLTPDEVAELDRCRAAGVDGFLQESDTLPGRWAVRNLPYGADDGIKALREEARRIAAERNAAARSA